MSKTKICVSSVFSSGSQINSAKNLVSSVKSTLGSINGHIDSRIKNRSNIGNRFNSLYSSLGTIERRISAIKSVSENGASRYQTTDNKVEGWKSSIADGSLLKHGSITSGYGFWASAFDNANQSKKKTEVDEKGTSDSTFEPILKDDWKIEGAVIGGSSVAAGSILGIDSSGTAEGDLLGGSIKTKSKAKWNPDDGDAGIEKSIEAEGHLADGKLEGNIAFLGGEIGGTVGSVGATGKVGATLFKDDKFSPALEAKLKAKAALAKGDAKVKIGSEDNNIHVKGSGTFLGAEAEASGSAGVIKYKDKTTGQTKTELGVKGKVGAEAYVAEGKISGGFSVLGVKIDAGAEGKAGGAGAEAEVRATTGGVSGKIGLGLGLGAGIEISIDWSGFSFW